MQGCQRPAERNIEQDSQYQALNELTLRCIWLMCEAWADNPVDLIVFENVPRLATRGRHLLVGTRPVVTSTLWLISRQAPALGSASASSCG